ATLRDDPRTDHTVFVLARPDRDFAGTRLPASAVHAHAPTQCRTYTRSVRYPVIAEITTEVANRAGATGNRMSNNSSCGMMPFVVASTLSTKAYFTPINPTTDSTAPINPATTASNRKGNWVYHRVAPTSRMMPTSVRLVNADSWMVFEININAAKAMTAASKNAALRNPFNASKNSSSRSLWFLTLLTPAVSEYSCTITSPRVGSCNFTCNAAGNDSGLASSTSSGCSSKIRLNRS